MLSSETARGSIICRIRIAAEASDRAMSQRVLHAFHNSINMERTLLFALEVEVDDPFAYTYFAGYVLDASCVAKAG